MNDSEHKDFKRYKTALNHWLDGREFYRARQSMNWANEWHKGSRKDGFTPEFFHQLSIAMYVRTLEKNLIFPEETMAAIFLHDIVEDKRPTHADIEKEFGLVIAQSVEKLTNQDIFGNKKNKEEYYEAMIECPIASIVKGADRIHNQQSMSGVFRKDYIPKYMGVTKEFILPMLHKARIKHPRQNAAYTNIRHVLKSQIELVEFWIADTVTA